MSVFEIHSVTVGYGEELVMNDLSMSVAEGEFVSLIGPNGAGKSTLVKVMAGDIIPLCGSVSFNGRPLRRYRPRDLARECSIVHQSVETIPPFTVYEFIRMGRFPHQEAFEIETERDRETIEWAAATTGVAGLFRRRLTDLSGGELQLVRIAHALAQNRSVIVLDEPISHLDIMHSIMIMDILWKLNSEGSTIVAVLHDINVASDYSSRIIGIKEGNIFFNGTPEEVLRYDLVERLFNTPCIVLRNPTTGKPFVYPVPGYIK